MCCQREFEGRIPSGLLEDGLVHVLGELHGNIRLSGIQVSSELVFLRDRVSLVDAVRAKSVGHYFPNASLIENVEEKV